VVVHGVDEKTVVVGRRHPAVRRGGRGDNNGDGTTVPPATVSDTRRPGGPSLSPSPPSPPPL